MSWQLLLAISVITYSFSTVLQRILMKNNKTDSVAYSIFFQVFTGILIGIYALFHGFHMPNLLSAIPNLILMIFLYGIANLLIFKSLSMIEASEFTIIFVTRALWTVLAALLFLHESFSHLEFLGTLLVLASVIIVSYKRGKLAFNKGSLYALLAAICFGLAFTNDAFLVRNFDVPSYLFFAFVLPGLGIMVLYPKSAMQMKSLLVPNILSKLFLLSVIYAISAITVFVAYQVGRNAAELGALNQTSTIVTVLLSIILLKETSDLWKKLAGTLLAFLGVLLFK